jgi:BTB/POZ domain
MADSCGEQSHCSKTVRFDVGGQVYKVSRSLIELYPDTMLARMVDTRWQPQRGIKAGDDDDDDTSNSTIMFIDRNGDRFQYVLDYMRDRQVSLPMTVSVSAFRHDLAYYGFDNAQESSSVTVGTPAEARELFATFIGNLHGNLDKFDELIKESENTTATLKQQKSSFKMAHDIFGRSASMQGDGRHTISVASEDGKIAMNYGNCASRYLKEYLKNFYGLDLVSVTGSWGSDPYKVVVKRCTGNEDGSKQPSHTWSQPNHVFDSSNNESHAEKQQQQLGVVVATATTAQQPIVCVSFNNESHAENKQQTGDVVATVTTAQQPNVSVSSNESHAENLQQTGGVSATAPTSTIHRGCPGCIVQ